MERIAAGLSFLDLGFQGHQRIVATAVLHGAGGVALIDPGPTSTLPALRTALETAGMSLKDVTALVLTHIHLDHSGSAGTLVREIPDVKVFVHESGARHLADPSKLVASAGRLYGDQMDVLWGEVAPVPPSSITTLGGGERIEAGGRRLMVEYTPGHASHHLSYFNSDSGVAFVGDTAGIKRTTGGYELPPTPPPDIDLEVWQRSLDAIGRWGADTLFLTHFGPSRPAGPHLAAFSDNLTWVADVARQAMKNFEADDQRESWFTERVRQELSARMSAADADEYEVAGRFDLNYRGLARYWTRKAT
jgi:glyoxylase-like metal-dependent hydrolase (beta-lactamase superfamily II)